MAKRELGARRWMIFGGLVGFVLIAAAIMTRRSYGYAEGNNAKALEARYSLLHGERVRLAAAIRDASSRRTLGPVAERSLGMRIPSDTQVVFLPSSARGNGPP